MTKFILSEYKGNKHLRDVEFMVLYRDDWTKFKNDDSDMVVVRDENYNQI